MKQVLLLLFFDMSIAGLTIDYGPFGFLDYYEPNFICNGSGMFPGNVAVKITCCVAPKNTMFGQYTGRYLNLIKERIASQGNLRPVKTLHFLHQKSRPIISLSHNTFLRICCWGNTSFLTFFLFRPRRSLRV